MEPRITWKLMILLILRMPGSNFQSQNAPGEDANSILRELSEYDLAAQLGAGAGRGAELSAIFPVIREQFSKARDRSRGRMLYLYTP